MFIRAAGVVERVPANKKCTNAAFSDGYSIDADCILLIRQNFLGRHTSLSAELSRASASSRLGCCCISQWPCAVSKEPSVVWCKFAGSVVIATLCSEGVASLH